MTLYDEMLAAGLVVGHWQTDLYVKDCPKAWEILKPRLSTMSRPKSFKSNIEGEGRLLDIPFAYQPAWDEISAAIAKRQ